MEVKKEGSPKTKIMRSILPYMVDNPLPGAATVFLFFCQLALHSTLRWKNIGKETDSSTGITWRRGGTVGPPKAISQQEVNGLRAPLCGRRRIGNRHQ